MYAEYLMAKEKHPDCVVLMQYPFCHFLVTYDEDADSLVYDEARHYRQGARSIIIVNECHEMDILRAIINKGSKAALVHMPIITYDSNYDSVYHAYWDVYEREIWPSWDSGIEYCKSIPSLPKFVDRASALFKKLTERFFFS